MPLRMWYNGRMDKLKERKALAQLNAIARKELGTPRHKHEWMMQSQNPQTLRIKLKCSKCNKTKTVKATKRVPNLQAD